MSLSLNTSRAAATVAAIALPLAAGVAAGASSTASAATSGGGPLPTTSTKTAAYAWTFGKCPTLTTGVTVVVGSGVRCAPGDPATAAEALTRSGHTVTYVQRYPGVICRIDGRPASDPCVVMPPATAYWAFYTAKRGATSWTYASVGATQYNPAPGTVVGFAFGNSAKPGVLPPK